MQKKASDSTKRFIEVPELRDLTAAWMDQFDTEKDRGTLSGYVLEKTHKLIESEFGPETRFDQVLEVGAGKMAHFRSVRHQFTRYVACDHDPLVIDYIAAQGFPKTVEFELLNGDLLPFSDSSFDRLIATHVLEHIPNPHLALDEWVRIVRPGGVVSIILPCDPGLLWRMGRHFGPRRKAEKAGLPYDYFMAREHVNSIYNLKTIIDYHFPQKHEKWWPAMLPIPDINLIYAVNIRL